MTRRLIHESLAHARGRRVRSMRDWAEAEFIVPEGKYADQRFRCDRQPYTGHWFDAIDSGKFREHVAIGPQQSGKTLCAFVIPLLYHLFEIGETVVCGVPSLEIAGDKWREDILPAIEPSRYRKYLPKMGSGSRGQAKMSSVTFGNGSTLRFMTAGGKDKSRAGFTARVLVVTETDGLDERASTSREASKIKQLEGRLRADPGRRRIYKECTVSTEQGHSWKRYQVGTRSRLLLPCPHCRAFVLPERENLVGWQTAESEVEAEAASQFYCPEKGCGQPWSEEDRKLANHNARLVHRDQQVEDGEICGQTPPTYTLGFRWTAVHNLFYTAGQLGGEEWQGARAQNEEDAERELRQWVWALPYVPPNIESSLVYAEEITHRQLPGHPRGRVPDDTQLITVGVDLGKRFGHWAAIAWRPDCRGVVIDYDLFEINSLRLGVDAATHYALRELHAGGVLEWQVGDEIWSPDQVFVDYNWHKSQPGIEAFLGEVDRALWRPTMGRGVSQYASGTYRKPKSTGARVLYIGERYHLLRQDEVGLVIVEIDADYWKGWVHDRLVAGADGDEEQTPPPTHDQPGTLHLFADVVDVHAAYARHLTAEHREEEFLPGKGTVSRWIADRPGNHWFDATYLACTAAHLAGVRLTRPATAAQAPQPEPRPRPTLTTPDGRPFLITER